MRMTMTAFCLLLAATASAETIVHEYDDRVVVEVTGRPQSAEESDQQERQARISSLEYERQQLTAELERLKVKDDGSGTMDFRQRRAAMIEKGHRMQEIDSLMRELGYQQPQAVTGETPTPQEP